MDRCLYSNCVLHCKKKNGKFKWTSSIPSKPCHQKQKKPGLTPRGSCCFIVLCQGLGTNITGLTWHHRRYDCHLTVCSLPHGCTHVNTQGGPENMGLYTCFHTCSHTCLHTCIHMYLHARFCSLQMRLHARLCDLHMCLHARFCGLQMRLHARFCGLQL